MVDLEEGVWLVRNEPYIWEDSSETRKLGLPVSRNFRLSIDFLLLELLLLSALLL